MNCQGVRNEEHLNELLSDPAFVAQEKLDGMRAVVHVTKHGLRILSRSAGVDDPTRPLEKTSALPHLAELKFSGLCGTILDTEILIPGSDVATISGTVHRKATNGNTLQVRVFIFDVIHYNHVNLTSKKYNERLLKLEEIAPQLLCPHISVLPVFRTASEKRRLYNSVTQSGGEGIILKNVNAIYVEGGRPSNNWYKAKRSATFDCIILGFTKGAGKYNNRIGAVRFGQYVEDRLLELGQASGMSDAVRKEMSDYPEKFIGKVVTIKGMERLRSGAIRHPQFLRMNESKHAKECIWYNGEQ